MSPQSSTNPGAALPTAAPTYWARYTHDNGDIIVPKPDPEQARDDLRISDLPALGANFSVSGKVPAPLRTGPKPSVAYLAYILIAAHGPLTSSAIRDLIHENGQSGYPFKDQTIRKALCNGDEFENNSKTHIWSIKEVQPEAEKRAYSAIELEVAEILCDFWTSVR